MLDDKAGRVELLLAFKLGLLVDVCEALILLFDAAELNASRLRPLHKSVLRVREGDHQVEKVFLREAVAVGGLLDRRLVGLASAQTHQDLIVAEVARGLQSEVLIAVFLGETEGYLAIEDQVELTEVFQALNDGLVGYEYAAVKLGDEEGEELGARLHHRALLVLIAEYVVEVANHWIEQLLDKLVAQTWLELE